MNKTIDRYVDLKRKEKTIKEELSKLSPEVTSWVEEQDGFVQLEDGSELKLVERKSWQYPNYLEDKVKTLKQEAKKLEKHYQIEYPDKWTPNYNLRFDDKGGVKS